VLFPGEDQFGGSRAVEKVVDAVREVRFAGTDGSRISITLSAGVALVREGCSIDDAFSDADRFLYQAATAGGNRVASSQSPGPKRAERVLLMMAEALTAKVLRGLFENDGFQTTHVEGVDGGLPADLAAKRFHLIVIDEDLPTAGGFEVLRELRAMPRNNRTPIVMLIAKGAEQSMAKALELGANDYVMRPFSPFTFIRRMRRVLKRGIQAGQAEEGAEICRVLIVDEDVRSLMLAASALHERGGFIPYLARGFMDGRRRLEEESPGVVVVCVDDESVEAEQFVRDLARGKDAAGAAVVLTTEGKEEHELERFSGPACRGSVQKPFDVLVFAQHLEELLGLSPSQRHAADAAEHLNREIQRLSKPG
jgi:PleD family two-component response regulator